MTKPFRYLPRTRTDSASHRRGFSLVEMIVSLILLGTVMSIVVPTLAWINVQNRLVMQRQEAIQTLHNTLDELTLQSFADVTPESLAELKLPPAITSQLPDAEFSAEVSSSKPDVKRIDLALSWGQRNGQRLAPVRVSAWMHRKEEQP